MSNIKNFYWKGIEELTNDVEVVKYADKEFPDQLTIKDTFGDNSGDEAKSNRRDFLKLMGFSVAAVSLAACDTPVKHAIPYIVQPEEITPGIPNYYASTYLDGSDYCSILVKTREGRPIFIEGNAYSNVTLGGTSALVNASIMSLYDIERAKNPSVKGKDSTWATVDKEISDKLAQIAGSGGQIRIVSNTIMSPSTKKAIAAFITKYPTAVHVTYDQVSASALTQANKIKFGKAVVPSYKFEKASVIASFGADFLGTWISPIEYARQFARTRKVHREKKEMSRLYAFEPIMSLTGANADYRTPIKPSQEGLVIGKLYNLIAAKVGRATLGTTDIKIPYLEKCAENLWANKEKALVVSGSNDLELQVLVNEINEMLGSYGNTIDMDTPSFQKQGDDAKMSAFVKDVEAGNIKAVIFYNANPVYDHPQGASLAKNLSKIELKVSTADRLHETASLCDYNCPDSHFLESWNDAEPKRGHFSLGQPTIMTIFNTRQVQQSLLTWAGIASDYLAFIRNFWKENLFPLQSKETEFELFWKRSLHNGVFEPTVGEQYVSVNQSVTEPVISVDFNTLTTEINNEYKANNTGIELIIYPKVVTGTGTQANNPYVHDTPDPISKMCWGNYASVSLSMANKMGFVNKENKANTVLVKVGNLEMKLPVVIQPGQAPDTVAIALGYGRVNNGKISVGKVANEAAGANMYAVAVIKDTVRYAQFSGVSIADSGDWERLASTQSHSTFMGRETIIQESVLTAYQKDEQAGRFFPHVSGNISGKRNPTDISIWDVSSDGYGKKPEPKSEVEKTLWTQRHKTGADIHKYPNHHWGMSIDLNSCIGCGACITACHIENNVAVVGKKEIINRREMHWIRIDRYYTSEGDGLEERDFDKLAQVVENPRVVFQPMMCQHCNNAPCETVCPVVATTHSSEGLNQMTYNRCIGTKYCANNCPYKVRRFNWFKYNNNNEFDYNQNNDLGKMVLNPDVTVRSRGVMEKCSLCVQRIQAGKLKAKSESRRPKDGEVITACASACPTEGIIFGDLNDPESAISKLLDYEVEKGRAYNVLSEINTSPNVWYLTKIRNIDEKSV
jgi:molybdopterin-containing oxidoreductase family iron-sulfur binding subunit